MAGTLADIPSVRLSAAECENAVRQARGMFNRVLAAWAVDLLALRREGITTPQWRSAVQRDDSRRQAA